MKAAVVETFDQPPKYRDFPEPSPKSDEVIVSVKAAALSQLVRAQASGKHYSADAKPPLVPGVDGVGVLDGRRVYFAFPRPPVGSMAERVAVNKAYCIDLPSNVDDVTAAAIANPGMSSWAALTERAKFVKGESVLINGATGAAGQLAIQIARHLGAKRVVTTGRNNSHRQPLLDLGADVFIPLDLPPDKLMTAFQTEIATGIDIVLDYLFGPSAELFLKAAMTSAQGDAAPRIRYVDIGSLAGNTITLPAASLRSSGVELLGSGLGSVSHEGLLRSIAGVFNAVGPAKLKVDANPVPLADVEKAWSEKDGRTVFTV